MPRIGYSMVLDKMENRPQTPTEENERALVLNDEALDAAIETKRASAGEYERAFIKARQLFDAERRALRALEEERNQRQLRAAGLPAPQEADTKPRRKRSTTGMDAVLGRDGIDPNAPFSAFFLMSLQRQEIILNPAGERDAQTLTFVDKETQSLLEARTFGEARVLLEQGHALGRPGVPLQRQAAWYVDPGKTGWLRLDQIFVERRLEGV